MKTSVSKISLHPPFSKGEFGQEANFPLFEKEGLGEIFASTQNAMTASGSFDNN
jgi:hypothetical protein